MALATEYFLRVYFEAERIHGLAESTYQLPGWIMEKTDKQAFR